jgi:hypothetical protein
MDFGIFPLIMMALCVVMMVTMMRGRHGSYRALPNGQMGCCGFGFGPRDEGADRLPTQHWWRQQPTSGNSTFDDYRADTLRRLEEEQSDFQSFLAQLRMAKDKAEFDQFMIERRSGQEAQPSSSREA